MPAMAFPGLIKHIQRLRPRQREQLRLMLAVQHAVASVPDTSDTGLRHCPHCGARGVARYGHVRGEQRWRCRTCERTFGAVTGTALVRLRHKSAWLEFGRALSKGMPVIAAAEHCGIHRNTAFRWRRRLMSTPNEEQHRQGIPANRAETRLRSGRKLTNARAIRTRHALRQGLLTLMSCKPYEHITIREIAAAANAGYATFFRHHVSKEELLKEIAEEELRLLLTLSLARVEKADPADPRPSSLIICQHVSEHRAVWAALLNRGAASTMRNQFIRLAIEHGEIHRHSKWLPVELGATHGVCAVLEILAWWLQSPGKYPPAQIAMIIDRLVVAPLMADSITMMQ